MSDIGHNTESADLPKKIKCKVLLEQIIQKTTKVQSQLLLATATQTFTQKYCAKSSATF